MLFFLVKIMFSDHNWADFSKPEDVEMNGGSADASASPKGDREIPVTKDMEVD